MNNATKRRMNVLTITIVPIKQPKPIFNKKGETHKYLGFPEYDYWYIKPNYIRVCEDDSSSATVYKRIKDSGYWRIVGLRGYIFALLVDLSI